MNYITYNSTTSQSLGIFVSRGSSFDAAAPDYTSYEIPGKNGDRQINNDRYKNIDVIYPVFIPGGAIADRVKIEDGTERILHIIFEKGEESHEELGH